MNRFEAKIERLFEFLNELNVLLDQEDYVKFQQQQELFGDLLKDFLNKHSESELNSIIDQLKKIKIKVKTLKERTDKDAKNLKEKSLFFQRNKNKIKAYK